MAGAAARLLADIVVEELMPLFIPTQTTPTVMRNEDIINVQEMRGLAKSIIKVVYLATANARNGVESRHR